MSDLKVLISDLQGALEFLEALYKGYPRARYGITSEEILACNTRTGYRIAGCCGSSILNAPAPGERYNRGIRVGLDPAKILSDDNPAMRNVEADARPTKAKAVEKSVVVEGLPYFLQYNIVQQDKEYIEPDEDEDEDDDDDF